MSDNILSLHAVPSDPDPLRVMTLVLESGPPLEAGSSGITLTCTVTENIRGLTGRPSAVWMTESNPVQSEYITETVNATTAILTLSLSLLSIPLMLDSTTARDHYRHNQWRMVASRSIHLPSISLSDVSQTLSL